jgi:hypothetical protein
MLERLEFKNIGPSPSMTLEFGERLNLLTGDNGLGKTFVLDAAWWALTRTWAEGRMLQPDPQAEGEPEIDYDVRGVMGKTTHAECGFDFEHYEWKGKPGRPSIPGLVVYARIDGGFSIWDPARNYWRNERIRERHGTLHTCGRVLQWHRMLRVRHHERRHLSCTPPQLHRWAESERFIGVWRKLKQHVRKKPRRIRLRRVNFELKANGRQVEVQEIEWAKHGDVVSWLESEAFDMESGYSVEAEAAMKEAGDFMAGTGPHDDATRAAIEERLRKALGGDAPFLVEWFAKTQPELLRSAAQARTRRRG